MKQLSFTPFILSCGTYLRAFEQLRGWLCEWTVWPQSPHLGSLGHFQMGQEEKGAIAEVKVYVGQYLSDSGFKREPENI